MIDKAAFEAHVRAEAIKKYADERGWFIGDNAQECVGYIAARMEHEWPLLEMLDDAKGHVYSSAILSKGYSRADRLYKRIEAALSPCTTKPIER